MNIFVEDGAKLGLFIRGGSDYGLGIYIAGVDIDGAAEQAGLKVCLVHWVVLTDMPRN